TPYYMSPEQARGLRNVYHRTAVWSLGVIACKCVIGKLPFDGESVCELLVKICTSPIPSPTQQPPEHPATFPTWFARGLEREPERRFSTVTELAEALAYVAGQSIRAPSSFGSAVLAAPAPSTGAVSQGTRPLAPLSGPTTTPQ